MCLFGAFLKTHRMFVFASSKKLTACTDIFIVSPDAVVTCATMGLTPAWAAGLPGNTLHKKKPSGILWIETPPPL